MLPRRPDPIVAVQEGCRLLGRRAQASAGSDRRANGVDDGVERRPIRGTRQPSMIPDLWDKLAAIDPSVVRAEPRR
jgi:hypothetical protein